MLTPEQTKEAYKRWRKGEPLKHIARDMGSTYYLVRTSFDLEYKEMCRVRKKAWDGANKARIPQPDDRVMPISIPRKVLREREQAYAAPMTLSQIICGDPPFPRSALARKAGYGQNQSGY